MKIDAAARSAKPVRRPPLCMTFCARLYNPSIRPPAPSSSRALAMIFDLYASTVTARPYCRQMRWELSDTQSGTTSFSAPGSINGNAEGRHPLAHELAHVVQQGRAGSVVRRQAAQSAPTGIPRQFVKPVCDRFASFKERSESGMSRCLVP
jgi:hypothetical protein